MVHVPGAILATQSSSLPIYRSIPWCSGGSFFCVMTSITMAVVVCYLLAVTITFVLTS
jgi:hypothetical protein